VDWLAEGYDEVSDDVARGYAGRGGDPLNDALRVSLAQRTLPGFLHYEDRNSMAFGVETRIPFLDHRLVEKVLPLPASLKLAGARTKSLLRQALSGRVPAPIVGRLAKQGYPVPISRWLRLQGGALWTDRVSLIAACPMIDFARWRRRFERFQSGDEGELPAVWRGLVLASWHARFIAGSA
jgi:asparagine synthase (glutamine-hydrolysing)